MHIWTDSHLYVLIALILCLKNIESIACEKFSMLIIIIRIKLPVPKKKELTLGLIMLFSFIQKGMK